MAGRINLAYFEREEPPKQRAPKRKDYLALLHELPCVVTGKYGVQAAHVSFASPMHGHYGRGKGTKAPDRFALPLCQEEHARQHRMNEQEFWLSVGINPHELANTLWGIFCDFQDNPSLAVARCTARINKGLAEADRLKSRDTA